MCRIFLFLVILSDETRELSSETDDRRPGRLQTAGSSHLLRIFAQFLFTAQRL